MEPFKKFYAFCIQAALWLCTILFVFLALCAFLKTAHVKNAYEIEIQLSWDNPLLHILALCICLILFYGIGRLFCRIPNGAVLFMLLGCGWVFCASLLWTYFSKSGPAFDCGSVYYAAKQFAHSDFSALSYRDSYFSVYPFQLGLAFFYELIFRIAGSDNFHILQGVNALCLVLCTFSQYKISGLLFGKKQIQIYTLCCICFCLPFIMYGSFIYGEIPSFAFILFGTWLFLLTLKKQRLLYAIPCIISLTLSVMVRKNSLIFIIALFLVFFLYLLKNHAILPTKVRYFHYLFGVVLLVSTLSILPLITYQYSLRSGTVINPGIPASTYLAMGLMEAESGPGHYNGYNFETFTEEADYNPDLATQIGLNDWKKQISYFMSHPAYALGFFLNKILVQWLNAGWAVFDSTYVSFGERLPVIESCFSGPNYERLIHYMSQYQFCLYFFVALSCICLLTRFRSKVMEQPALLLFPLTALGGFLVYLFWEASGRYILPYAIFMLPYGAHGLYEFISRITET